MPNRYWIAKNMQDGGPGNLSGIALSFIEALDEAKLDKSDPTRDSALGLMAHWMHSLSNFGFEGDRDAIYITLRLAANTIVNRCRYLREHGVSTEGMWDDVEIRTSILVIYFFTKGRSCDESMTEWRTAMGICASEASNE